MKSIQSIIFVPILFLCHSSAFLQSTTAPWGSRSEKINFWSDLYHPSRSSFLLQMSVSLQDDTLKIIIAGAPASGKGTQCEKIKETFGVVHLSTGDMLRSAVAAGTEVGKLAKEFMDSGRLVPDEVIINVVRSLPFQLRRRFFEEN